MTKLSEQVRAFMSAFGQVTVEKPCVPSDDVVRLRLRLVAEELCELLEACTHKEDLATHDVIATHKTRINNLIAAMRVGVDLVDACDALGDIDYVCEGARRAFGVDGEPIADAIHASNMAKVGGYFDEHKKWRKPAGWVAPDLHSILVAQGWET